MCIHVWAGDHDDVVVDVAALSVLNANGHYSGDSI